jgi:SAM-dependent methyltransferase
VPRRPFSRFFKPLEPRQYDRSSFFNAAYLTGADGIMLDIGCGGFLEKYNFAKGVRYYGLDITSRATHIRGDALYLPVRDSTADWVLLVAVLEHVLDPMRVLQETRRVLKPGGRVYVAVPFLQMKHGDTDYWRWTDDGIRCLIQDAGFKILHLGTNGGFQVAMDYLLWHRFREASRKRNPFMALAALALKAVAQPMAMLARDLDDTTYATSFHLLIQKADG